jgi:hypothetical protein
MITSLIPPYMNDVFWLVDNMGIYFYQFLVFLAVSLSQGYLSKQTPRY